MPKNKISEYSSNPANNTDIGSIDIAEGCAPSGINNAIRELMAQLKDQQAGTDADSFTVGGALAVTGTSTLTGAVTATAGVTANLTGNVTGNVTGNLTGNVTGNASGTSASITSVNPVANGGTGLATLTANNVILGNGTSTPSFVAPSTSGNVLTSNGTTWQSTTPAVQPSLGVGQTWQNLIGSRALGSTYTNSTGKPIMVSVSVTANSNSNSNTLQISVSGVSVYNSTQFTTNNPFVVAAITVVPNGATYVVTGSANGTAPALSLWAELI